MDIKKRKIKKLYNCPNCFSKSMDWKGKCECCGNDLQETLCEIPKQILEVKEK